MKKRDLIKALAAYPDDAEIVLYNSFVRDYQPILKVTSELLYRQPFDQFCELSNWRREAEGLPPRDRKELRRIYQKNVKWRLPISCPPLDDDKVKNVLMLIPGRQGVSTFYRGQGTVEY